MNYDPVQGYPGFEKELDSLLEAYGSEAFTRSLLQVYTRDCPMAMQKLVDAIEAGEVDAAGKALHSLSNILGVVGPASSRPLIEGISAELHDKVLKTAARQARELDDLIQAVLVSIAAWLERPSGEGVPGTSKDRGNP